MISKAPLSLLVNPLVLSIDLLSGVGVVLIHCVVKLPVRKLLSLPSPVSANFVLNITSFQHSPYLGQCERESVHLGLHVWVSKKCMHPTIPLGHIDL